MSECESVRVNLLDCQLDKLKSAAKNKKIYHSNSKIMTTDMICMDKTNFCIIYDWQTGKSRAFGRVLQIVSQRIQNY